MALTGRTDGPALGPPDGLVDRVDRLTADLTAHAEALGGAVAVDGVALLGERAAVTGLGRRGRTSCGGASQVLRTADGWLALTLARPDDRDLLPAWLDLGHRRAVDGAELGTLVADRPTDELVGWGATLGLAVAEVPSTPPRPDHPVVAHRTGEAAPTTALDGLVVVDLSALWAGPLCGALLAEAGAEVVKVESTARPDGSRRGPGPFFDLLNAGKRSVALDLTATTGRRALRRLLQRADVVIEGSRPRALEQMGIDAAAVLADRPRVWVSITGHGRDPAGRDRVGFGDDAAAAGGLVVWERGQPCFCADAVADPLSGLVAAGAVVDHLRQGGRWLLDVALARTAAWCAGPTLAPTTPVEVAPPRARPSRGTGPRLGTDTAAVLGRLTVTSADTATLRVAGGPSGRPFPPVADRTPKRPPSGSQDDPQGGRLGWASDQGTRTSFP